MWMNLDRLPASHSMYTLYYFPGPAAEADPADHDLPLEEVDCVAPAGASRERIESAARAQDPNLYDWDQMTLIGVADQSSGYFAYIREGFGSWVS